MFKKKKFNPFDFFSLKIGNYHDFNRCVFILECEKKDTQVI